MEFTREQAWDLLCKYNHEPFHLRHALTVEAVMEWFARQLGYEAEAPFWGQVGLLHDIDFEGWPEEHCVRARTLLEEAGAALMRPSKSVQDMELSSLKKKFKDKKFAAGCSRDTIRQGAENLGWELDELLSRTLQAMKDQEALIESRCAQL